VRARASEGECDRDHPPGGFSLHEFLIALTVATVVGSALVSLIRSQSEYYARQEDAVVSTQNIRAVYELMGAEVRSASGADFLFAGPDSFAVRSDVLRAVVCDSVGPDEAVVFVYDSVAAANLPPTFRGTAASPPADSIWAYSDSITLVVRGTGSAPRATCAAAGAPTAAADTRYRHLAGFLAMSPPGAPPRGTLLRVYGRLTFSFVGGFRNRSLRRNSQELATPFGSGTFSYRLSDGSLVTAPASTRLSGVVEVSVGGTTFGTATASPHPRSFTHRITLRNGVQAP